MRRGRAACISDRRGKPSRRRRGPAQDDEAERLYDIALKGDLRHQPFDHARLQLAYGAWLRGQRRVSESRPALRAARQVFDALACGPWGERARQELRAAGEQNPDRVPAARDRLTAQELQTVQRTASPRQRKVHAMVTGTMGLTYTDEGGFNKW
jgi:hypothetical protein